jgi:hypothetical protein
VLVLDIKGEEHARLDRIVERQKSDLTKATRRLAFYEKRLDPKVIAEAERASGVESRWPELVAIAERRLSGKRGWRAIVMRMLGVGNKTMRNWELGTQRIPEPTLETLTTAPIPAAIRRPSQARKSKRQKAMPLSGEAKPSQSEQGLAPIETTSMTSTVSIELARPVN